MTDLTEDAIEQNLIDLLKAQGYDYFMARLSPPQMMSHNMFPFTYLPLWECIPDLENVKAINVSEYYLYPHAEVWERKFGNKDIKSE